MANHQSSVRFDHREIAVIFSLFIFVSLLMFTVGILVGKGLAQARYEGTAQVSHEMGGAARMPSAEHEAPPGPASMGTSITTEQHHEAKTEGEDEEKGEKGEKAPGPSAAAGAEKAELHAENSHPPSSAVEEAPSEPAGKAEHKSDLELVPAKPHKQLRAGLESFPGSKDADAVLKNPKMKSLFEEDGKAHRGTASIPTKTPKSFAQGKFTVQVGSYPTQKDALERVESLKKAGFPYAYFSAKDLGGKTWFRVWLGFFQDAGSAEQSGEMLQSRGEVKSYLVRTTDTES